MTAKIKLSLVALLVFGLAMLLTPFLALAQPQPPKTDFSMWVRPESYNRKIRPGETTRWFLELQNHGTTAITAIRLSAEPPDSAWKIEMIPASIAVLSPGTTEIVDVYVTPPGDGYRGSNDITIIAEASETRRVTTLFVQVQSAITVWLWVGVALGAAVITGMVIVFLRIGKD